MLAGVLLKPATITTKNGNPFVAVIIAWLLVQVILALFSSYINFIIELLKYANS